MCTVNPVLNHGFLAVLNITVGGEGFKTIHSWKGALIVKQTDHCCLDKTVYTQTLFCSDSESWTLGPQKRNCVMVTMKRPQFRSLKQTDFGTDSPKCKPAMRGSVSKAMGKHHQSKCFIVAVKTSFLGPRTPPEQLFIILLIPKHSPHPMVPWSPMVQHLCFMSFLINSLQALARIVGHECTESKCVFWF